MQIKIYERKAENSISDTASFLDGADPTGEYVPPLSQKGGLADGCQFHGKQQEIGPSPRRGGGCSVDTVFE